MRKQIESIIDESNIIYRDKSVIGDFYEIHKVKSHYEVYLNGQLSSSEDTYEEAQEEIESLISHRHTYEILFSKLQKDVTYTFQREYINAETVREVERVFKNRHKRDVIREDDITIRLYYK